MSTLPRIPEIQKLLGRIVVKEDSPQMAQMRAHQAWWRFAVLNKEAAEIAGNRLKDRERPSDNFISKNAWKAYEFALSEKHSKGKSIDEARNETNLLASQVLCFNAFGELREDQKLASQFLSMFFPNVKQVTSVEFEYRPDGYINESGGDIDKSGVDVAFFFQTTDGKINFFGFEVKYTDPFSAVATDRDAYRAIYNSNRNRFAKEYDAYRDIRYNELFRNDCIASWLENNGVVENASTGIFFPANYEAMAKSGREYQDMIANEKQFRVFTYEEYLAHLQRMDISWDQREWLMHLWARYCGLSLSAEFTKAFK